MPKNKKPMTKSMARAKSQSMVSQRRYEVDNRVDYNSPTGGVTRLQTAPSPRIRKNK